MASSIVELSSSDEAAEDELFCAAMKRSIEDEENVDDDDVIIIDDPEISFPPSRRQQVKRKLEEEEDDDDDCCVLACAPDVKALENVVSGGEELVVTGETGPVACRDFPHARHLCVKLPFKTTSHLDFCQQCHCYVCDTLAPCTLWTMHCHASDNEESWKEMRKSNSKSPELAVLASLAQLTTPPSSFHHSSMNRRARSSPRGPQAALSQISTLSPLLPSPRLPSPTAAPPTPLYRPSPTMADYALGNLVRGFLPASRHPSAPNIRHSSQATSSPAIRHSLQPHGMKTPSTTPIQTVQRVGSDRTAPYRPSGYLKMLPTNPAAKAALASKSKQPKVLGRPKVRLKHPVRRSQANKEAPSDTPGSSLVPTPEAEGNQQQASVVVPQVQASSSSVLRRHSSGPVVSQAGGSGNRQLASSGNQASVSTPVSVPIRAGYSAPAIRSGNQPNPCGQDGGLSSSGGVLQLSSPPVLNNAVSTSVRQVNGTSPSFFSVPQASVSVSKGGRVDQAGGSVSVAAQRYIPKKRYQTTAGLKPASKTAVTPAPQAEVQSSKEPSELETFLDLDEP